MNAYNNITYITHITQIIIISIPLIDIPTVSGIIFPVSLLQIGLFVMSKESKPRIKNGRYTPVLNDGVSIVDGKYVFEDKRRKSVPIKNHNKQELLEEAWRKKKRYASLSKCMQEYWKNKTPLERAIHGVKVARGQEKAKMYKEAIACNSQQPCVGCQSYESHIYRDVLPKVVWICKDCEDLYNRYG